jgi:hypothetical protein
MSGIKNSFVENEETFNEYITDLITSRANRETIGFLANYYIH